MPAVLILTGAAVGWLDPAAMEVAGAVGHRIGPEQVRVVGALELGSATWDHRIEQGVAQTRLRFGEWTMDSREIGATLNLVRSLPSLGLAGANEGDRAYADTEIQALFVSFLAGFRSRVINGVDGQGSVGSWSQARWAALAQRCELSTSPRSISVGTRLLAGRSPAAAVTGKFWTLVVVGDQVLGQTPAQMPAELPDRCRRLAQLSGCEVLALHFAGLSEPRLLSADPFPQLAGEVAEAVAGRLCELAS